MCDGHRERLRERYRRAGFNAFAEYELLELLLFYALPRRDTKAIARKLLERFGSLSAVIAATPAELKTVEGVGEKTAAFLCLVGEIDRRAALAEHERTPMNTRGAVAEYCYHLLRGRKSECVYALLFDARFNLIAARLIAEGLPDRVALLPRRVAEEALAHAAVHVVLTHNHPAGDSTPSAEDLSATQRVREALSTVGISLSEHIIVTDEDTYAVVADGKIAVRAAACAQTVGEADEKLRRLR